jgi:hypothetical protein
MRAFQEQMEKEKRAKASHLRAYYGPEGLKLGAPMLNDVETVSEAIHGFYRIAAPPSMTSSDGAINGHVALPRSKFGKKLTVIGKPRAPSAAASSATGKEASVAASTAASANLARSASGPVSVASRAKSGPRAATPARSASVSVISQPRSIPQVGVRPATPGGMSAVSGSQFTSISQRPTAYTNSSLQNEVENLVLQQMERVVQPLQRKLGEEMQKRMGLEEQVRSLMTQTQKGGD